MIKKNKWFITSILLCLLSSAVISFILWNIYVFIILFVFNVTISSYNYRKGYFDRM
jgi:uncharacterized membrane protein